jgi:hypothetical protein
MGELSRFFSRLFGSEAKAEHLSQGDNHCVSVENLRVLVYEEEPGVWIAQCIDVDYTACGETAEAAKRNFEIGLMNTLHAHLKKFGTLQRFFKYPPHAEWMEAQKARNFEFSLATTHVIDSTIPPVAYIEQKLAA